MSAVEPPSSSAAAAPAPPAVAPIVQTLRATHTPDSKEQLLQPPPANQQRDVAAGNGHNVTVTLAGPLQSKQLTSWVWRVMSRLRMCLVGEGWICHWCCGDLFVCLRFFCFCFCFSFFSFFVCCVFYRRTSILYVCRDVERE